MAVEAVGAPEAVVVLRPLVFSLGCNKGWESAEVVQVVLIAGSASAFRCSAFPTPQQSTREHGEEAEQYDKFSLHGWLL